MNIDKKTTMTELKEYCKSKQYKNYTSLRKKDLIQYIKEKETSPDDQLIFIKTQVKEEIVHEKEIDSISDEPIVIIKKLSQEELKPIIKQLYLEDIEHFVVKEIAEDYDITQKFINDIIKSIDKIEVILHKKVFIEDYVCLETCELCKKNKNKPEDMSYMGE